MRHALLRVLTAVLFAAIVVASPASAAPPGFSFSFPVNTATTLKLTLSVNSTPFDLAGYIAGGGTPTFTMTWRTSSGTTKVVQAASVYVAAGDASNVASIQINVGQVLDQALWQATLSAAPSVWTGTATSTAYGSASSVTAGGIQTVSPGPDATPNSKGAVQLAGDFGGSAYVPQVTGTHLATPLPQAQGGTGAASLTGAGAVAIGGDLSGTAASPQVVGVGHLSGALPSAVDASQTSVTATGSTTARALRDRWADVVNVRDYGAKGDGVTDDRAAIQSAINAAAAGQTVYVPASSSPYMLSATLTVPSGITLAGAGPASVLKRTSATQSFAVVANSDYIANSAGNTDIVIRDLAIDGNGAAQGFVEFRHNVALIGVKNALVTGCRFVGMSGDGVYVSSTIDSTARSNYSRGVRIIGNHFEETNQARNGVSVVDAIGVVIAGNTFLNITSAVNPGAIDLEPDKATERVQDVSIVGNTISGCRQGIQALNSGIGQTTSALTISGNTVASTNNSGNGIVVSGWTQTTISGNDLHAVVGSGIVTAGASVLSITGNAILGASSIGIWVGTGSAISVTGNAVNGTSNDGIRFSSTSSLLCASNALSGWGGSWSAIRCDGCTGGRIAGNTLNGGGGLANGIISVNGANALRGLAENYIFGVTTPYSLVGSNDFAAAAPTTGTWIVGERVRNIAPAIGQPKGWVCTVAGTPGTWVSEGNL